MKKFLLSILFVFFTFVGLIFLILSTSYGTQKVLINLKRFWPHIQYQYVAGNFISGIKIKDLQVETPSFTLQSQNFQVSLNPLGLLVGKMVFNHLSINNSFLLIKKTNQKDDKNFHIPIKIKIAPVKLKNLKIQYNNYILNIDKLKFYLNLSNNIMQLDALNLQKGTSILSGNLYLYYHPYYSWKIQIQSNQLLLKDFNFAQQGFLNFLIKSEGQLTSENPFIKISITPLNGQLFNHPLTGNVQVQMKNWHWKFSKFNIHWANAQAFIQGNLNKTWNLDWRINIPSFEKLLPNIKGYFNSEGVIQGDWLAPNLKVSAKANNIDLNYFKIKNSDLSANINSSANIASQLNFSAENIEIQNKFIKKIQLFANGTLLQHQVKGIINSDFINSNIDIAASFKQAQWRGFIKNWNIMIDKEYWKLNHQASFILSKDLKEISSLIWQWKNQSLGFSYSMQRHKHSMFSWNIQNLNWDTLIAPLFQLKNIKNENNLSFQGNISGNGVFESVNEKPFAGSGILKLSPGQVSMNFHDELRSQRINRGQFNYILNNKGFNITGIINMNKADPIQLNFSMPGFVLNKTNIKNQKIMGKINANLHNLNFFSLLIHHLENPEGILNLQGQLTGTLQKPLFSGKAIVANGTVNIPSLELKLKNIHLEAIANNTKQIRYTGSLQSGAGTLFAKGYSDLKQPGFFTNLQIQGKNIQLIQTSHYNILGNPNVKLLYQDKKLRIIGPLYISKAKIISDELRPETIEPSQDIIFIDEPKMVSTKTDLDFSSQLNISLGPDIEFNVRGASGQLTGHLNLNFNPQTVSTAAGQLFVENGIYKFYGTALKITRGRLLYTGGPIDNPGIDIQATRTVASSNTGMIGLTNGISSGMFTAPGQIKVGVNLIGSLKDYQVILFSEPSGYDQTDILSLLIFGSVTDSLTGSSANRNILLQAASSLNFGGSSLGSITEKIQNAFGLDQLGLEQQAELTPGKQTLDQNTAFVVGKKIGSRIYISYSLGVQNPVSLVRIRFNLTRGFYVQTENSARSNGVDIFYSFEH